VCSLERRVLWGPGCPRDPRIPRITSTLDLQRRARYFLVFPLGTRRRPFVLSGEDEIMTEQLKFGALLESMLPRLCLVIHFGEFLQRKSVSKYK
jgi:hypothetical protein